MAPELDDGSASAFLRILRRLFERSARGQSLRGFVRRSLDNRAASDEDIVRAILDAPAMRNGESPDDWEYDDDGIDGTDDFDGGGGDSPPPAAADDGGQPDSGMAEVLAHPILFAMSDADFDATLDRVLGRGE